MAAAKLKVRKGDRVKVIAGKSQGHVGNVLRTDPVKQKVYVEGLNVQKRHQRPMMLRDTQRTQSTEGGVIEREGPIHISNVMLLDPKTGDPTRVGIKREGGRRVRIAKRSGQELE